MQQMPDFRDCTDVASHEEHSTTVIKTKKESQKELLSACYVLDPDYIALPLVPYVSNQTLKRCNM